MNFLPLALVIVSAFSHALWNYLAKGSDEKELFMFLLNLYSTILFMPILYFLIPDLIFPIEILPYLIISGVAETIYFLSLGKAYETGDLSIVYPLARSSPLFVAIIASVLLKEKISLWGYLGIFLVIIGVYALHLKSLRINDITRPLRSLGNISSLYALVAALGTTVYSISDKKGVTLADPLIYAFWLGIIITSFLGVIVLSRRSFTSLKKTITDKNFRILISGFLMKGGYILVLVAMRMAQVSYILSIRQVSVVIGAFFGLHFLKEENAGVRVIGAVIIFLGVYILGILA